MGETHMAIGVQRLSVRSFCTILSGLMADYARPSAVCCVQTIASPPHCKALSLKLWAGLAILLLALLPPFNFVVHAQAQTETADTTTPAQSEPGSAPVVIDGETYFVVVGARSFTAEQRAIEIQNNILKAAERYPDRFPRVTSKRVDGSVEVYADGVLITHIIPGDVEFEGIDLDNLTEFIKGRINESITKHREGRRDAALEKGVRFAALWTVCFVVLSLLLWWIRRISRKYVDARIRRWIQVAEENSGRIINGRSFFRVARHFIRGIFLFIFFIMFYVYVYFVLSQFSPTQYIAFFLIEVVADPLVSLGVSAIRVIPDLLVLGVIYLMIRFLLSVMRLFFENIANGVFVYEGFDKGWVWPTYRIVRVGVIVAAIIVAYPYIPGSGTEAFQGMTIFLGVLLTLSSGSVAGNLIAGLFVIYKRSVNIGDRIQVGTMIGDVESISFVDTQLRSLKNEMISIPNTSLISDTVINFTRTGGTDGLVVHITVGIGYDEAPEEIERLLIKAALKTKGLARSPAPFVLTNTLGSHDVGYEINAILESGSDLVGTRSRLNSNILAEFNAGQVQIMTPFYVADPAEPKIAPTVERAGSR